MVVQEGEEGVGAGWVGGVRFDRGWKGRWVGHRACLFLEDGWDDEQGGGVLVVKIVLCALCECECGCQ